ncbi:MAG: sigma-70 family RNA polymerase sigma factor [Clostridia bacterium]|nr:sigma-70 family RNA polymerase sigma factor [Clostridia bacterium]
MYQNRDEHAIEETAAKFGRLCLKVANNLLANPEDANECVNDTYLAVWNAIPPAEPENLTAFVCRITRNLALKRLETANAAKRTAEGEISLHELEEILPDTSVDPHTGDDELGRQINAFLLTEKPSARNVFIRKYWFFDSVSEIARRYGYSENKVKSILFRTRNKLKIYLKKEGFDI